MSKPVKEVDLFPVSAAEAVSDPGQARLTRTATGLQVSVDGGAAVGVGTGNGVVATVAAGAGIAVDSSDPANPIVSVTIVAKPGTNLTNADATIQPVSDGAGMYTLPTAVPLTVNRVLTLGITGAVALALANVVTVVRRGAGAFSLTVKDDAGTTLSTFASGSAVRADTFYFDTGSAHYKYLSSVFVS